ncbi:hypothetical protein [Nocardiopsis eucommiae]|uniref:hypothetical protein n=1 Tax=Nocardiopsis eucommiae TaxID=2831970 RepID=UPI003D709A61
MTDADAVLWAAVVGGLAAIVGGLLGSIITACVESRRQEREEQYRISAERRNAYAHLANEFQALVAFDRSPASGKVALPDMAPMESSCSRVMTIGSPGASEAAEEARTAVRMYRMALAKAGHFRRMELGVEASALAAVRKFELACRSEAKAP